MRSGNKRIAWCAALLCFSVMYEGCVARRTTAGSHSTRPEITSISARLSEPGGLAPGDSVQLVVSAARSDGKILATNGSGSKRLRWEDLKLAASTVTLNDEGIVSLSNDPRMINQEMGQVRVSMPSYPALNAELSIPLRFDRKFSLNFSGKPGAKGKNGTAGDFSGADGANGGMGQRGEDAPTVDIWLRLRSSSPPLLEVKVSSTGSHFFLIDPRGGSLDVRTDGGAGGKGGKGGGGFGVPGKIYSDGRVGDSDYQGKRGGNGPDGPQGYGGKIMVVYDPQAAPYLSVLHLSSRNGPAPTFSQSVLNPLW